MQLDQVQHGWAMLQHPGSDCQRGLLMLGPVADPDNDATGRNGIGSSAAAAESLGLTSRSEGEPPAITTIPSPPDDLEATLSRLPVAALCRRRYTKPPGWVPRRLIVRVWQSPTRQVLPRCLNTVVASAHPAAE